MIHKWSTSLRTQFIGNIILQLPVVYETVSTTSCQYMERIPPVTMATRVKWRIYVHKLFGISFTSRLNSSTLAVILCRFVILTTSIHFNNLAIVRVLSSEHLSKVKSAYSARNGAPTIKMRQACPSLSPFAKKKEMAHASAY